MQQRDGLFITIEGTGGSGKDTQAALLKQRLEKAGYDVAQFNFPRRDEAAGYFVREYRRGTYGSAPQVGPYTAALFYALDRYQAAPAIREALSDGKVVVVSGFTGSSMARLGAQIAHPEERRGFYLWLDNVEFSMLKIPRPGINLVLHLPEGFAQQKAGNDQSIATSHVFDELSQLFPKDFMSIDCVRSGQLLEIEAVHNVIWGKIEPLLPLKPQPAVIAEPATAAVATAQEMQPRMLKLQASQLARMTVATEEQPMLASGYFTPTQLPAELREEYVATMDAIMDVRARAHEVLHQQSKRADNDRTADLLLPLSTYGELRIASDEASLRNAVRAARSSSLLELKTIADVLESLEPKGASLAPPQPSQVLLPEKFAQHSLPQRYTADTETTALVNYAPRNELQAVANIFYEFSDQPLAAIEREVAQWPYDKKAVMYRDYLDLYLQQRPQTARLLQSMTYTFDVVSDIASLQAVQQLRLGATIEWQQPSPRLGYETPAAIDEAGLTEEFEDCFDRSLALYSRLQSVEAGSLAPYAVLRGHRIRWKVTLNAAQLAELGKSNEAGVQPLTTILTKLVAEAHPLFAAALQDSAHAPEEAAPDAGAPDSLAQSVS